MDQLLCVAESALTIQNAQRSFSPEIVKTIFNVERLPQQKTHSRRCRRRTSLVAHTYSGSGVVGLSRAACCRYRPADVATGLRKALVVPSGELEYHTQARAIGTTSKQVAVPRKDIAYTYKHL